MISPILCFTLYTPSFGNFQGKVEICLAIFEKLKKKLWKFLKISSYNFQSKRQIMTLGVVYEFKLLNLKKWLILKRQAKGTPQTSEEPPVYYLFHRLTRKYLCRTIPYWISLYVRALNIKTSLSGAWFEIYPTHRNLIRAIIQILLLSERKLISVKQERLQGSNKWSGRVSRSPFFFHLDSTWGAAPAKENVCWF